MSEVSHYRDSNGKEIDAIITLPDGRWGAVEAKRGGFARIDDRLCGWPLAM